MDLKEPPEVHLLFPAWEMIPHTWFLGESWTQAGTRNSSFQESKVNSRSYPHISGLSPFLKGKNFRRRWAVKFKTGFNGRYWDRKRENKKGREWHPHKSQQGSFQARKSLSTHNNMKVRKYEVYILRVKILEMFACRYHVHRWEALACISLVPCWFI